MSLTMGTGPLGHVPAGRFNRDVPRQDLLYVEASPRRIRALLDGQVVVDSRRAQLLFQPFRLPRYFFPRDDVRWELAGEVTPVEPPADAPGLEDHVAFPFDAMDAWREEEEEIIGHAPDPYHRIDVRSTTRHVRVSLEGQVLAESERTKALFETSLPTRWYFPREDVVAELVPSDLITTCAYKGHAGYRSVRVGDGLVENLAWTYAEPRREAEPVRDLLAFFNEQVDLDVDGERQPRPGGPWAQPGWWKGSGPDR
jgi:uncharacterized protein (DUF427 family)